MTRDYIQETADNMIFITGDSLKEIAELEEAFDQWWEKNKKKDDNNTEKHFAAKAWYAGIAFYEKRRLGVS